MKNKNYGLIITFGEESEKVIFTFPTKELADLYTVLVKSTIEEGCKLKIEKYIVHHLNEKADVLEYFNHISNDILDKIINIFDKVQKDLKNKKEIDEKS